MLIGPTRRWRVVCGVSCVVAAGAVVSAQHWPPFRGPQGLGVADEPRPEVRWDVGTGRGVTWKSPVPGLAHSSPVIRGQSGRTERAVHALGGRADNGEPRRFPHAVNLEETSETSANVSIGDLDGDGDLDLVLAKGRHWPLTDRVLLNNGKGEFAATDLAPIADRSYSAVLTDVDGNGTLDLVLSNDKPDNKLVYLNDGRARFRSAGTWGAPEWATRNAAVADLNGDGRPDIIAANRGAASRVCLNDGAGRFDAAPCLVLPAESATIIVPGDFNKDGAIDLAVPHRDGGQSRIFFNDGKAGFAKTAAFGPPVTNARAAAAGDLNGDLWLDLVVGDERTGTRVYLNDGHGALVAGPALGDPALAVGAIAIADLNRDGHADIAIGHVRAPGTVWFNAGDGRRFTDVRFGDGRGAVYGIALGDLNGDGYPDIATARSDAPNVVYFSVKQEQSNRRRVETDQPVCHEPDVTQPNDRFTITW